MSFQRTVPASPEELLAYIQKIASNLSHVKHVEIKDSRLEVTLDWAAHLAGNPDIYLPIKPANTIAVQMLVDKLLRGGTPTKADASELWSALDSSGA